MRGFLPGDPSWSSTAIRARQKHPPTEATTHRDRNCKPQGKNLVFSLDPRVVIRTLAPCSKSPIHPKPGHSGAPEGLAASNPLPKPPLSPPESARSGGIRPKGEKANSWH